MAPRRRGLLKYLLIVPTVWLITIVVFTLRTDSPTNSQFNQDLPINVVNRISTNLSIVERIRKALPFQSFFQPKQPIDHDHPPEERVKAHQQAKKMNAIVQVLAPEVDDHRNLSGPGEMGNPVKIDKNKLSPIERKKYDDGWKNNAFNQYASDMISVRRSLADVRDPECKKVEFQSNLPDASVIIIFHNEARSVLLRTIWSVLDRTPAHLLKEVILVDDFSDKEHLKKSLEDDISSLNKVRLLRTDKREGLIRARLVGAYDSTGKVLIFLDSHCECAEGWIEPLLDPIARNSKASVVPIIEIIDDATFEFRGTSIGNIQVGGFDWNLIFNWHVIPEREFKRRKNKTDPIRSPTMAGGLFAIDRNWFEQLGMYDPGMDIWGGENLELSFKLWQCGGELLCAPCSHVGHVFRKRSPYSWPKDVNVVKKNSIRLAEVWMDDYKKYYYERINYNLGDYGDVSDRLKLRQQLQCKPFKWFIDNIYPEQFIPGESLYFGEIRNQEKKNICVDSQDIEDHDRAVIGYGCHGQGGNQYFLLTKNFEIRREEKCLDYVPGKLLEPSIIRSIECHSMKGNQMWSFTDHMIKHASGYCMELSSTNDRNIYMNVCDSSNPYQKWSWTERVTNTTANY